MIKDMHGKLRRNIIVTPVAVEEIQKQRDMAYDYKLWRCEYTKSKYNVVIDDKTFTVNLEEKSCSLCTFRQQFDLPCQHILAVLSHVCDQGLKSRQINPVPEEQTDIMEYIHPAFKYKQLLNLFTGQKFEIPPNNGNDQFPSENMVKPPPHYHFSNRAGTWQPKVGRTQKRRFKSNGEFGNNGKTFKKKRTETISQEYIVSTQSASSMHKEIMLECRDWCQTDSMKEEMPQEHIVASSRTQNILEELCKHVVGPNSRSVAPKKMHLDTSCWERTKTLIPGSYIIGEDPAIECGFNPNQVYESVCREKSQLQEAVRIIITYAISKGIDAFIKTYRELSRFVSGCDEYARSSAAIIHAVMAKDTSLWGFIPPEEKGNLYKYLCGVNPQVDCSTDQNEPIEVCIELSFSLGGMNAHSDVSLAIIHDHSPDIDAWG